MPAMQSAPASQELIPFCRFNARSAEKSPRFAGFQMRLPCLLEFPHLPLMRRVQEGPSNLLLTYSQE